MTTKKKNILIAVLATFLLSAFIFVMFFLDDLETRNNHKTPNNDETSKSISELFDDALSNWNKECEKRFDFFHNVNKYKILSRDNAPETIEKYPVRTNHDMISRCTLTYKETRCIENVFVYDYYTSQNDNIELVAIDRNTGACAEIKYTNKALRIEFTEENIKKFIQNEYNRYAEYIGNAKTIDWSKYTLQITTAQNISCVTYRKYLPNPAIGMDTFVNQSYATADCAYMDLTQSDGVWYVRRIRLGNIGMFPNEIVAYQGQPNIKSISDALNISTEVSEKTLMQYNLYHELMYINGKFLSRWSGECNVYLPEIQRCFLNKNGDIWYPND